MQLSSISKNIYNNNIYFLIYYKYIIYLYKKGNSESKVFINNNSSINF